MSEERFDRVERRLDNLDADMKDLKTDVSELKTDVSELKTDVSELKTDVSELKTDVSELKTDVSELKTDVAELKTNLVGVAGDVDGLKRTTVDLGTRMGVLYEDLVDRIKALAEGEKANAEFRVKTTATLDAIQTTLLKHVGPGEAADRRLFQVTDDHERRIVALERRPRRRKAS